MFLVFLYFPCSYFFLKQNARNNDRESPPKRYRSRHLKVFYKKGAYKISGKLIGKHLDRSLFNKITGEGLIYKTPANHCLLSVLNCLFFHDLGRCSYIEWTGRKAFILLTSVSQRVWFMFSILFLTLLQLQNVLHYCFCFYF